MKNYVGPCDVLDIIPAGAQSSGDLVMVGDLGAVCSVDIGAGETGSAVIRGRFTVDKDTDVGSGGDQGKPAYFHAGKVTALNHDGASPPVTLKQIGVFAADCADADTSCDIKLNG